MDTKTITLHDTDNFGSSLQAFGLQYFLLQNGISNEIIDYRPSYLYTHNKAIYIFIRNLLFYRASKEKNKKFKAFKKDYLKVTSDEFQTNQDLIDGKLTADCFICGSDQIWNSSYPCGKDPAFYLDFVKDSENKTSYAASLGKSTPPAEEINWITKNIKNFRNISVREETSKILLEKSTNNDIQVVCDPVLLVPKEKYFEMAGERIVKEKYAFLYLLEGSELLERTISYLRDEKGLKIIFAGSWKNKCSADVNMRDLGPIEFLNLLKYADFVLSSSFHATVFSVLFEKRFGSILPIKNQERIRHILSLVEMESKIVTDDSDLELVYQKPQFGTSKKEFNLFIENSKKWLLNSVESKGEKNE